MPTSPDYDRSYYRDREAWPDFRLEAEALARLARLGPKSRVLEVGCGGGGLLRRMAAGSRLAVGVDLNQEALQLAAARQSTHHEGISGRNMGAPGWVARARAESLPFPNEAFDAVVAQHLLEHMDKPESAVREWRRVLRPGGTLALATPNALHPDPTLFYDPTHVNLFTPATLCSLLEIAGFRMVHISTLFPFLGRGRAVRAISIRVAPLARRLPPLAWKGRTIVAAGTVIQ